MKWLLIVALSLAGLLVLIVVIGIVVIGALLTQKHHVSRTIMLHQPAETVWILISGLSNWRLDIRNSWGIPSPRCLSQSRTGKVAQLVRSDFCIGIIVLKNLPER